MPNLKGRSAKRDRRDEVEDDDDIIEEEYLLSAVTPDDGDQDTSKTFLFKGEGHTLGNALRFVIATYPEIIFCAYSLPHPSEDLMHFRIKTVPGIAPQDILQRGLHDLLKLSEIVIEKFDKAMANAPPSVDEDEEPFNMNASTSTTFSKAASATTVPVTSKVKSRKSKSKTLETETVTEKFKKTTISVLGSHTTSDPDPEEDSDEPEPECVDLSDQ